MSAQDGRRIWTTGLLLVKRRMSLTERSFLLERHTQEGHVLIVVVVSAAAVATTSVAVAATIIAVY